MSQAPDTARMPPPASLTLSTAWLLVAKTLSFIINIALPLLIVRRLSQVEFGHYKQVFLVVATANTLLPFGFGMTAFYFFPREPNRHRQVIFNVLLVYTALGAIAATALAVYPPLLTHIFGDPSLERYSTLIGLLIPVWMLSYLIEIIPIVNKEFVLATRFIVASQMSRTLLLLLAAAVFGTVQSLVIAAMVHCTLQTAVLLRYVGLRLPGFWRSFDRPLLTEQVRYAIPQGYAGLIWSFQNDLHNYFVSHSFGPAAFAVYANGCFQIPLMGMLSEAASSVLIGKMSELKVEGNTAEMIALTARVSRKLSAAMFPIYAFLLVCGREFIVLLFTRRYIDSWPVFAVNLTLIPIMTLVLDPIIRAYPEHMSYLVKMRTILFVLLVGSLWFFVGRLGPISAITIAVLTTFVDRALIAQHLSGVVGFRLAHLHLFRDTGRLALCSAGAAVVAAVLRYRLLTHSPIVILLVCGVVFVAVYAGLVILLRIATEDEWASVLRRIRSPKGLLSR